MFKSEYKIIYCTLPNLFLIIDAVSTVQVILHYQDS